MKHWLFVPAVALCGTAAHAEEVEFAPLVADPRNLELNRAQVRYAGGGVMATAGRQRIALADR